MDKSNNLVQGSNPRRFIILPKNDGDLFTRRVGGVSTMRFASVLAKRDNSYYKLST